MQSEYVRRLADFLTTQMCDLTTLVGEKPLYFSGNSAADVDSEGSYPQSEDVHNSNVHVRSCRTADWGSSAHLAELCTGRSSVASLRLVVIAAWGAAHPVALSTSRSTAHLVASGPTLACVVARRGALGRRSLLA